MTLNHQHVNGTRRSPLWAVLLSLAATGLGHIYCGRLIKGLILFFVGFAVAPLIVTAARHADTAWMVATVVATLLAMLAIFIYAVIDAGLTARAIGNNYQVKEYNCWPIYLLFIVISISYPTNLAATIRQDVVQLYKIASESMAPNLIRGDKVVLNKAIYKIAPLKRGDAVIFVFPDDRRKDFLKRVVALPGDTIEIRENILLINDRPLPQNPAPQSESTRFQPVANHRVMTEENGTARYSIIVDAQQPYNMSKITIPHGHCFVMGDNRSNSVDSRRFGAIPLGDIKGRLDFIYWPAESWDRFGWPAQGN